MVLDWDRLHLPLAGSFTSLYFFLQSFCDSECLEGEGRKILVRLSLCPHTKKKIKKKSEGSEGSFFSDGKERCRTMVIQLAGDLNGKRRSATMGASNNRRNISGAAGIFMIWKRLEPSEMEIFLFVHSSTLEQEEETACQNKRGQYHKTEVSKQGSTGRQQ